MCMILKMEEELLLQGLEGSLVRNKRKGSGREKYQLGWRKITVIKEGLQGCFHPFASLKFAYNSAP